MRIGEHLPGRRVLHRELRRRAGRPLGENIVPARHIAPLETAGARVHGVAIERLPAEGPLPVPRRALDDRPVAMRPDRYGSQHGNPGARADGVAVGMVGPVPVRGVDGKVPLDLQQPALHGRRYLESGWHVGRRTDWLPLGRQITFVQVAVAPQHVARALVERRGIDRQLVVGPLPEGVLARDHRPFAGGLGARGGDERSPLLHAARTRIQFGKRQAAWIGTHVARALGRLDGRAVGLALGIARIAHAHDLEGPGVERPPPRVGEYRPIQLGRLDPKVRRQRNLHVRLGERQFRNPGAWCGHDGEAAERCQRQQLASRPCAAHADQTRISPIAFDVALLFVPHEAASRPKTFIAV